MEFLGVFFLTLFKGISNVAIKTEKVEPIFNAVMTALVLFIFLYSVTENLEINI